jgi:hypothetical protein
MKAESGRRVQLGEPIVVGAGAMIPYKPATPSLPPHEATRRTNGERRIPSQLRVPEPTRAPGGAMRATVALTTLALSGLAVAIAMASHLVG